MGPKQTTHHSQNHRPLASRSWPKLPLSFAVLERSLGGSRVKRLLIVLMLYRFQFPPTFSKIDCHIPSAAATSLEPTFDCDSSIEAVDKSSVADEIEFSSSSTVMIVKSFANWSAANLVNLPDMILCVLPAKRATGGLLWWQEEKTHSR